MRRTDFLLALIRTRNGAAIASLVALVIGGRILGKRRSTWVVVLLGLLAVTLGYVLSGHTTEPNPGTVSGNSAAHVSPEGATVRRSRRLTHHPHD